MRMIPAMAEIHPTAIIGDQVQLDQDVTIGPWCVLEGPVTLGAGTHLLHRVTLKGPLVIGRANRLYPNAAIGYDPQDVKSDPAHAGTGIIIGDENVIREGVTIHRATSDRPTTVGDRNYLMVNSHLGHDVVIGHDNMLANGTLIAGHVEIADRVIFGGNAVVHQFCRVGRLSMIAGIRGVAQDIPPFCTVYSSRTVGSLNLIGLRRAGYRKHVQPVKKAFDILYRQSHTRTEAVRLIREKLGDDPLCVELADFVAASKRGIAPYASKHDEDPENTV